MLMYFNNKTFFLFYSTILISITKCHCLTLNRCVLYIWHFLQISILRTYGWKNIDSLPCVKIYSSNNSSNIKYKKLRDFFFLLEKEELYNKILRNKKCSKLAKKIRVNFVRILWNKKCSKLAKEYVNF